MQLKPVLRYEKSEKCTLGEMKSSTRTPQLSNHTQTVLTQSKRPIIGRPNRPNYRKGFWFLICIWSPFLPPTLCWPGDRKIVLVAWLVGSVCHVGLPVVRLHTNKVGCFHLPLRHTPPPPHSPTMLCSKKRNVMCERACRRHQLL